VATEIDLLKKSTKCSATKSENHPLKSRVRAVALGGCSDPQNLFSDRTADYSRGKGKGQIKTWEEDWGHSRLQKGGGRSGGPNTLILRCWSSAREWSRGGRLLKWIYGEKN